MPIPKKYDRRKNRRMNDKQKTEQNKIYAAIAKAAITQSDPKPKASPNITLTNKTHIKLTGLIWDAHLAALNVIGQYGKILSKSLKDNVDIDATFLDRDSKKIFGFYYTLDLDQELSDMDPSIHMDQIWTTHSLTTSWQRIETQLT